MIILVTWSLRDIILISFLIQGNMKYANFWKMNLNIEGKKKFYLSTNLAVNWEFSLLIRIFLLFRLFSVNLQWWTIVAAIVISDQNLMFIWICILISAFFSWIASKNSEIMTQTIYKLICNKRKQRWKLPKHLLT